MRFLHAACIMSCIGLFMLGAGCTTSDNPAEPGLPVPTELSGTVGAGGGTLTSSDGLLSMTIPAGALAADTEIGLREMETSEMDPAFGDAVARKALELSPAGLSLALPAQITFEMSISLKTFSASRAPAAPDKPELADFIICAVNTSDIVRIPDQRIDYYLKPDAEKNVKATVDVENGGQIIFAGPLEKLGSFGQFAAIFGPDPVSPTYAGIPKQLLTQIHMPDEYVMRFGDTYYENDPLAIYVLPSVSDGEPWAPADTTVLDNDRVSLNYRIDVTPQLEGMLTFGARLGGKMELVDLSLSGLPLGEDPVVGELDFVIELPSFTHLVDPPVQSDLTIQTGMTGLRDLCVTFGTIDDPAPLGNPYYRWLYLVGAEGVKYYRLVESGGRILSAEFLDSIYSLDMEGVLPVSTEGTDGMLRELFIYGTSSWITGWNASTGQYGMMGRVTNDEVFDAVGYGGLTHTDGFSFGRGHGAYFFEYNPVVNLYANPDPPGGPIAGYLFPGDGGPIVCVTVHDGSNAALVIKDGLPGEIWYHARQDIYAEGLLIGNTGSEPQQIRGAGGFYAISNYISSTLTTFTWSGGPSISNVSSTLVGLGPEGIDVTLLGDGTPLVVCTNTIGGYTLSHFSITGTYLGGHLYQVPATCTGARYAIFIGMTPDLYVALSCHDSGTVEIIPVDLQDFQ